METVLIQRHSSLLYARAYRNLLVALTVIYFVIGAGLSVAAAVIFKHWVAGLIGFVLVLAMNGVLWAVYLGLLRVLAREAQQAVEVGDEGVRETHGGKEYAFIPWEGVKEIEVDAAILAGASLRVKGNFSEISVSNVDLEITGPVGLIEMHRALGRVGRMRELLARLKAGAPQAELKLNRLARRPARRALAETPAGANRHD